MGADKGPQHWASGHLRCASRAAPSPAVGSGEAQRSPPDLPFLSWAGELPLSFSGLVLAPVPGNCLLPVLLCHRPRFWWPPPRAAGEDGFLMPEHSFPLLIDSLRSG